MEQNYDQTYLRELAYKWKNGILTKEEKDYLDRWDERHADEMLILPGGTESAEVVKARIHAALLSVIHKDSALKRRKLNRARWLAAAAAIMLIAVGIYFYKSYEATHGSASKFKAQHALNDIQPGYNQATLTLGNGKTITLSDKKNAIVVASSHLTYNDGTEIRTSSKTIELLKASTPRGGQYQVLLPDGTHVWLNSMSSIQFPSKFTGDNREVELTGEAYFEVAKNKVLPFIVKTDQQRIKVLGTHFNVNSYRDEPVVKTTLLEGSVSISSLNNIYQPVTVKPGQEAVSTNQGIAVKQANMEADMAWKNGLFIFKNSDLKTVMRQLSRWYDIDVEFKGPVPLEEFNGKVYRNMTLNEVLEVLSFSKVKFKIEGKKMTII